MMVFRASASPFEAVVFGECPGVPGAEDGDWLDDINCPLLPRELRDTSISMPCWTCYPTLSTASWSEAYEKAMRNASVKQRYEPDDMVIALLSEGSLLRSATCPYIAHVPNI